MENIKIDEILSLFFEIYPTSHNSILKKKKKKIYSYSYFINLASCRVKKNSEKVYTFGGIFYKIWEFIYSIIGKGKKITSKFIWNSFYASYSSKGDIFMNGISGKVRIANGISRKVRNLNGLAYGEDENNDMINRRNFKNNTSQYFTCFLDKATENPNALNEIDKWVDPKTKSCYCHDEHAEPCSLADISEINQLDSYMNNEMCNSRNNNKNDEIFIALAGYNILKCKRGENKNMNENKNKNNEKNDNNIYQHDPNDKLDNEKMYKYCKYGLKLWNNKNMYNYNNCNIVKSLDKKNKNVCIEMCREIQTYCNEKGIQFYSFDICKKYYETNLFSRPIFINIFKYFDDNCSYFDPNNHGIVLCKHRKVKCNFSSWSDWSECNKSCLKDEYDIEPIQKRTRFLDNDMEYASKACSVYMSDDNNTLEVQVCTELPYCNDINDSNQNVTSKIKKGKYPHEERLLPFVISLDEINKANALKELNNNDTDITNENFIINKSEILTNCMITDMNKYNNYIKYNEKNRSCSCPNNEPTCYFKDIYNSSTWKKKFENLCKKNNNINIVTADFILINCNMLISLNKKEISVNTYLAMTFDCRSPLFQYLFCSKPSDHNKKNLIYIIITIIFGAISAIYFVYLIVKEIIKYKDICFQFGERNISQMEKTHEQTETPSEEDIIIDNTKRD
ncbi:thrombospondin-related protein-1 [Plasmodium yoelii yoelii]|nr:thrombospondin-related protein-1 [Plasmodium yoelii yoelii]